MTPPNLLTILRVLLVPVFILLLVYGYTMKAFLVFLGAGLTDLFDGLIARRFNQRSELGTLLDPIADKTLLISSFVALSDPGVAPMMRIPLWLTITVISRDILIITAVIIVNLTLGKHIFLPTLVGKWTTAVQLLTVLAVLFCNAWMVSIPFMLVLYYATLAFTVVSGLHYVGRGMKLLD
jgi:cardiolipin synthase